MDSIDEELEPTFEDGVPDVVRTEYDWTTVAPSTAVMEAVASFADCGPTEMGPLYDHVDPDSLDQLVSSARDQAEEPTTVAFEFDGYHVTVRCSGLVVVQPAD